MEKVYKVGFFTLMTVLSVMVGWFLRGSDFKNEELEETEVFEEQVVNNGNDVVVEETMIEEEDLGAIFSAAFEEKYSKATGSAEVSMNKVENDFVSGLIKFAGETGGGWFLGAKSGGSWQIVADGNGTINCSDIEPYDFSTEMVPECWNEATMSLIKR